MHKFLASIALAAAMTISGTAVLAGNHKSGETNSHKPGEANEHKPAKHGGASVGTAAGVDAVLGAVFEAEETRLIRDYFGTHRVEAKPLPPGIAKNLARGKPLPPGIAKRYLPGDLSARLPVRDGYERLIVGDDVLLISTATGIIVDILSGAL